MKVYRLSAAEFADDISGQGAYLYGGRWNPEEIYMLYTASNISLAVLETLVNLKVSTHKKEYTLLTLDLPLEKYGSLDVAKLSSIWSENMDYTQQIGVDFIQANKSLALQVPSVVIHQEFNLIINPKHIDFKKIKVVRKEKFIFDKRLLK